MKSYSNHGLTKLIKNGARSKLSFVFVYQSNKCCRARSIRKPIAILENVRGCVVFSLYKTRINSSSFAGAEYVNKDETENENKLVDFFKNRKIAQAALSPTAEG